MLKLLYNLILWASYSQDYYKKFFLRSDYLMRKFALLLAIIGALKYIWWYLRNGK